MLVLLVTVIVVMISVLLLGLRPSKYLKRIGRLMAVIFVTGTLIVL